ncbi:MAG TPA: ribosome rescue protein RqcH [Thermoplasmata archaeon]|nr:ribosome rescue protein RqcH [Thermoplasmata archaeon]
MAAPTTGPVKERFTALDTQALVRELRTIERARVDKVFDRKEGGRSITFRVAGEGRRELVLVTGRFAALVASSEHADELTPLSRELRRLLTGARLHRVAEPGGERYLELELEAGAADPPMVLAAELFGTGNLLVARGGRILAVERPKSWARRTVRIGAEYERPPIRTNPWEMDAAAIEAVLLASRTDRATTLAARLALGGPVAEEVLVRAALEGSASAPSDAPTAARGIRSAIEGLLAEVGDRPKGFLYRREGAWIDVEPFASRRMRSEPGVVEEVRPTFSEAALEYFGSLDLAPEAPPSPEASRRAGLERQRDQQRRAIEELAREADRLSEDADALLVHYGEAERALSEAVHRASGSHEPVEISVGGRLVPVVPGRSIRESARHLFGESKRVRAKLDGARAALAESERRLASPGLETGGAARRMAPAAEAPRKPNWFERYRWFLSSEGILVVAGRDAASNDLLVRRYLHDADLYLHADIHGAPSVIIRNPPPGAPPPSERTFEEAAQFGVSFSKAWRAGLASASAFWVRSDQVSKAGASGEFVARGAWVIHGEKHVVRDAPTRLAIGTQTYEGEELWTVAPPRAFEGRGTARFLLTPGEEARRAELEVELSTSLGLSRPRLQSLLPAGGIAIGRA